MNVPSPSFLAFAAVAAVVFNLRRSITWRQAVLLVANILFLGSFAAGPASLLPFAAFILVGYVAYLLTLRPATNRLFPLLLVVVLAAFFWLKRYAFVPPSLVLPFPYVLVGLSYVFFRVVHVIIDGHQGDLPERIGPVQYLNYTLNFTSLVSGPIQYFQDYRRMERQPLPLDLPVLGAAIERIITGYFKVAIVSTLLGSFQHDAIADLAGGATGPGGRIVDGILVAALYPLYLYFNFSGYVDLVIGVARLFRIELPENFNRPFSSPSFIAFWGRWHMTLSGWLKTYVYNPLMLGGMKRVTSPSLTPYVAVFAFFVTFFLVGLWHGQTTEFLFFGLLQGGGVAANKLYQIRMASLLGRNRYRALAANQAYVACCRGLTFTWFTFTLFWFWSDWPHITLFARQLGWLGCLASTFATWLAATLILAVGEARWQHMSGHRFPVVRSRYVRTAWGTALVAVTVVVALLSNAPAPDIVYKTF